MKTLHPAIHGGLLANRADPTHVEELAKHSIEPIDLVISNLYPFEKVRLRRPPLDSHCPATAQQRPLVCNPRRRVGKPPHLLPRSRHTTDRGLWQGL